MRKLLSLVVVPLGMFACDGDDPIMSSCVSGVSIACVCPGGAAGAQVCLDDGTFGECDCSVCGDGVLAGDEECDAGWENGDGYGQCGTDCVLGPRCGDGTPNSPYEQCDAGDANSDTVGDACRTDCSLPACGDAVVDTGELCDDGANDGSGTCGPEGCTVCGQDCQEVAGLDLTHLTFRVIDAEYSRQLDRLVMVSSSPNAIHLYAPADGTTQTIELPLLPSSVSVGPDGTRAAIGHNGWISYVDLATPALVDALAISIDVLDVVLAGNGYVYGFPRYGQWAAIHTVKLDTGVETTSSSWDIYAGTVAKLHPDGSKIYGANNGLSPSDIERYDIGAGTAAYAYDSPYHGDHPMCGDLWMSEDGMRIFTACGRVFRSSDVLAEDMTYNGALSITSVLYLDHHAAAGKVLAIAAVPYWDGTGVEDARVSIYDYEFLSLAGVRQLPRYLVGASAFPIHGRFVFFAAAGDKVVVIGQVDPEAALLHDYVLITMPL